MTDGALALALLDSRFRLESDDARMLGFVRELWEPFVIDVPAGEAIGVTIERLKDRWRIMIDGDPGAAATDPWVLAAVLRNSISRRAIAEAESTVPLHGAAVERDGIYVALSGPPKTGKTTLLLELLDRGWRLVTDDLVPLDPGDLTAAPFLKPLSVREPGRWRRFASGWAVPGWLPEPRDVALLPATVFACADRRRFSLDRLFFPSFVPGVSGSAELLTAAQTVTAAASNLHPAAGATPRRLAALAQLGAGTRGQALTYGSTRTALELFEKCLAT